MSRIYWALKKAEREKRHKVKRESTLKVFEERDGSRREEPIIRPPARKTTEPGPVSNEETSILIAPTNSFSAEQFRMLRTQIFLQSPNPPHSILITSTTPAEGKTMVAVNLAVAISQDIQKKAILIDGDLRKPSTYFGISPYSKGLSDYLSNQTSLSEILSSVTENLWIIPAGTSTEKPAELVGSKKMRELVTVLHEFEGDTYIIIDSPPILSTTEPTLLSKIVDGVIVVVMADRTPRESVKRAIKSIDHQKIIGVVLNQIDAKLPGYYSGYYHYYRYYKK